jgi:hypothetical protein
MDCRTARLLLEFTHPGGSELAGDPAEAAALETHLHICPDCDAVARTDRRVDAHIGQAMRAVPLPVGLRQRVKDRLARHRAVAWRRWAFRAIGSAAALILVAVSWWVWAVVSVPALSVAEIQEDAFGRSQASGLDSEKVSAWFREKYHVTTEMPRQIGEGRLNYGLLVYFDLGYLQGKQVPMLIFQKGGNTARVYLVTDSQFRFKDIPNGVPLPGSGYTLMVWQHPSNSNLAYVVLYSGDSLQPFLDFSGAG